MKVLPVLLLTTLVAAEWQWFHYDEGYFVINSCQAAIAGIAKLCKKPDSKAGDICSCVNPNYVASWLNCAYERMDTKSADEWFVRTCEGTKGALSIEEAREAYQNATGHFVNVAEQYVNTSKVFNHPVYSTGEHFENVYYNNYWSNKSRRGNITTSHYLGIAFMAFTVFVMLASGLVNWSQRLSKRIQLSGNNFFVNFYRRNVSVGILGKHLSPSRWGYTPDRLETILITIMCLYTILTSAIVGVHWRSGDISFHNYQSGTSRYYGDRSGILLSWKWPLLFIFPGRNNIFQWVTRWKYGRFVTFHKWLARCVFFDVLVHSFAFASQTYGLGPAKVKSRFAADWYDYGICSTVFAGVIMIFAIYQFRSRFYDFFKIIHLFFVCFMLWTGLLHAQSQDYEGFYYAAVGIWVFEYVARILRVCLFGYRRATISYCQDDQVLKLVVPASRFMKSSPGSHAFLYFLTKKNFYRSHCFTAVPSTEPGHIEFYCKVKNGLTLDLAKLIGNQKSIELGVLVEGFYGESSPYQYYDKSVFVTGSTGIAGPFAHTLKLVKSDSQKEVKLYWSVRTLAALEWFKDQLMELKDTQCRPIIYVSQPNADSASATSNSGDNNSSEEKEENLPHEKIITSEKEIADAVGSEMLAHVEIRHGRLDVATIVAEELASASGSVAFGACSHVQVVDSLRSEVSRSVAATGKRVEYFEEMQTW